MQDLFIFTKVLIEKLKLEEYVIELYYESMLDTECNDEYLAKEVKFDLSVDTAGDGVVFGNDTIDWVSYGESNSKGYIAKDNADVFGEISTYGSTWVSYDSYFSKEIASENLVSRTATAAIKDFSFEINTVNEAPY